MPTVKVTGLRCSVCAHEWFPRYDFRPKVCPKCKRSTWDGGAAYVPKSRQEGREPVARFRP